MVAKREHRVQVMMHNDELHAINEYRHKGRFASLSKAIRHLCKTALVLAEHNEADKQKWLASLAAEPHAAECECLKCCYVHELKDRSREDYSGLDCSTVDATRKSD